MITDQSKHGHCARTLADGDDDARTVEKKDLHFTHGWKEGDLLDDGRDPRRGLARKHGLAWQLGQLAE